MREFENNNQVTIIVPAYKNISGEIEKSPKTIAFKYAPKKFQMLCHKPGGIPATLASNKYFIFLIPSLLIALYWNILKQSSRHDIIHANWAVCGAIAGIVCKCTNRPLVTTLRGDDVNNAKASLVNRLFLKIALAFSRRIVTVSDDLREQLIHTFNIPTDKILTIPNGVNDAFFKIGQRVKLKEENQKLTLITVGSIIPRKNIAFIIKALSKLPEHIHFKIIGDGSEKENLLTLTKELKLDHRINFLGDQDPESIPDLLGEYDIFVLCSLSEGRSNALYEAMASGKAIIASDIPGNRELISDGDTGLIYTSNSEPDFINLVKKLDNQRTLICSLGRNAYRWMIKNKYTWNASEEKYSALFQEILL